MFSGRLAPPQSQQWNNRRIGSVDAVVAGDAFNSATIFSSIQVFKNGFNDHVGIAKVAFPRRTIVREGRHVTAFYWTGTLSWLARTFFFQLSPM
jgi:hypothetical protein